jgi:hypothetical protein
VTCRYDRWAQQIVNPKKSVMPRRLRKHGIDRSPWRLHASASMVPGVRSWSQRIVVEHFPWPGRLFSGLGYESRTTNWSMRFLLRRSINRVNSLGCRP